MSGFCKTSICWDGSRIWCGHFSWKQLDALVVREKCEASVQLILGRYLVGSKAEGVHHTEHTPHTNTHTLQTIRGKMVKADEFPYLDRQ